MPAPDSLPVRVLLTALVAFGPISTDLYLPSLPALVGVFGTDIATVQLTLSVFLVGFAVSQLVYGPLSDRFGRRPVLVGGAAVYVVASVGCALAGSVESLIVWRFFQAFGACCGPVVGRAVVRDVFGRDRSASILAYMAMAMTLAPAVGPILGGHLTQAFGWRSNFVFLTLFGVLVLLGTVLWLKETNTRRDAEALKPRRLFGNYVNLFRDRAYVGYVLTGAFAYSGIFSFISGSSFVLVERLGLTPALYGMSFASVVLGYTVGTFLAGRIGPRLGIDRMMALGTLVSAAAGLAGAALAVADVTHLAAILGPMFLFILGAGLVLPNSMAGAIGPYPAMAGAASAMLGFVQMGVGALAGVIVGHLHDGTQLPMMAAIGTAAVAAAVAYRALVTARPDPA